ncbi:MAG: peptidylprolyl isomerase [Chloroflexota bacterium]
MSEKNKPTQAAADTVVTIEYTLTVDGEVVDSSKEGGPLDYLQGHANIIPGLEREIEGMKVGESKSVLVAPEDGYGLIEPEAILEVARGEFPPDVPMDIGVELEITDDEGDMMFATIIEIGNEIVKLDTNHPLSGKELSFEVTVTGLRAASAEEIEHGHVHFGGDHDHD